MSLADCCILNAGGGAWAFAALARQLSAALWVDVADVPRRHNYLLLADDDVAASVHTFVPLAGVAWAADKRAVARAFAEAGVPTPFTRLVDTLAEAVDLAAADPARRWCLKFPTGCGAAGHRFLTPGLMLPPNWPRPLVVQEFIRLDRPEVFRMYAAGGDVFGWVVRRYAAGVVASPWVAHARGARWELDGDPPTEAIQTARLALGSCSLLDSFGCVDLLRRPDGRWVALETGTDGLFNHVDRDLGLPALERQIQERIAGAFWARAGTWRPWGEGA